MKITEVKAIVLSYDYKYAIADAQNYFSTRSAVIVLLKTDSGLTGIGEAACFGGPPENTKYIIEKELSRFVLGQDPEFVELIWKRMWDGTRMHGRRGIIMAGMSGIDIAIWDLIGKSANMPLYKVLGGYTNRLLPYASSGFYQHGKGTKEIAEEVGSYFDRGFKYAKIKVGRNPEVFMSPTTNMPGGEYCTYTLEEDLERVEACCSMARGKGRVIVDANNTWTTYTAIQMGRAFEKMGVFWLEEPVHVDNIRGSAQVAQALDMPVAGYESEIGLFGFREFIINQAVDIVQPDVIWSGGITECRKIAALAYAFNLPVNPHIFSSAVSLAANMHFLASLNNGGILEFDQNVYPLRDELTVEPITINRDGFVYLPEKPGLGIELNEEIVKKYRVDKD